MSRGEKRRPRARSAPPPARETTDESLRSERSSADEAVTAVEAASKEAHDLVLRSREKADAVVVAERDLADRKLETSTAVTPVALARGRAKEDDVVRGERADADAIHRRERDEQLGALRALLPIEREETDQSLLEERAHSDDALDRRDDFLGIVSHDLRNLLNGVVLSASLIARTAHEPDAAPRTVASAERILRQTEQMSRLLNDLVDVASIDAGKLAIVPTHADAAAVLSEVVDAFAPAATKKEIALVLEPGERPLFGWFDRGRLFQVLGNLMTNALKFTPSGGTIRLRAERSGDDLALSVGDTGVGIEAELLEAVFERFWQVREEDRRGLGLGLYISRSIIEAHHGRIWAESEPGKGSTFRVTIPGRPTPDRPSTRS